MGDNEKYTNYQNPKKLDLGLGRAIKIAQIFFSNLNFL
jgi:hypothetical protein